MLPQCLFLVNRHGLIFERQMHTSFGWEYREQFHTKHIKRKIGNTCNTVSLSFRNLSQYWTKTGLEPAPKIPPLEWNLLRDFPLLSLLLRSTPGRLSENGPLNPFLIFQISKFVVNYLSRTPRWALIQSNQLPAFL